MRVSILLILAYSVALLSVSIVKSAPLLEHDSNGPMNHDADIAIHRERSVQQGTVEATCYATILSAASSTNGTDNVLDQHEFIVFCNLLSNNAFAGFANFTNFPLVLVQLYNNLAVSSCKPLNYYCNGGTTIDVQPLVNSTVSNQTLGTNQSLFFTNMCLNVNQTIRASLMTSMPPITHAPSSFVTSRSPTVRPSVVNSHGPSSLPSRSPTVRPSKVPSARPTVKPTVYPTSRPSSRPTAQPTSKPTVKPSIRPTVKPTVYPTYRPSSRPTAQPTSKPTDKPSIRPTAKPISKPTVRPSSRPSSRPSGVPTIKPSTRPTTKPTVHPTSIPSSRPSRRPSKRPSISKSKKPTFASTSFQISTPFILVNVAGLTTTKIVSNDNYVIMLDSSFRKLVRYVLSSCSTNVRNRRNNRHNRNLLLTSTSSQIVSLQDIGCPSTLPRNATCQRVVGNATVYSTNENVTRSHEDVMALMSSSIANGLLTFYLNSTIFTADLDALSTLDTRKSMGSGLIAGITVGAVALGVIAALALLLNKRGTSNGPRKSGMNYFISLQSPRSTDHRSVIGATTPNYGRMNISGSNSDLEGSDNSAQQNDTLLPEIQSSPIKPSPRKPPPTSSRSFDEESSSNAGSSGWSSSAGASSYTSASANSLEYGVFSSKVGKTAKSSPLNRSNPDKKQYSVSFSPLGMKSLNSRDGNDSSSGIRSKASAVSHLDLDYAIESADWAAVSATAAILAQQDTRSDTSSRISVESSASATSESSAYRDRAVELDHLIEIGDWEGVVLAAEKFESEADMDNKSSSVVSPGRSISTKESINLNNSVGASSELSPNESGSTNSKARKLAEQRAEVAALVRRVVPSEINNVDEMMFQFRGREDELLETLRSMQERSIAQRARMVSHRDARLKAKSSHSRFSWMKSGDHDSLGLPPVGPRPSSNSKVQHNQLDAHELSSNNQIELNLRRPDSNNESFSPKVELDHADDTVSSQSLGSLLSGESKTDPRTALETAVEAEDWNAAGKAAARMGDASESSVGTSDLGSLGESTFSSRHSKNHQQPELVRSRVVELDTLIEKGDWSGVVAAATRFGASDAKQGRGINKGRNNRTFASKGGDLSSLGTGSGGSIEGANWKKRLFNRNKALVASSLDGSRGMPNTDGSSDFIKSALQEEHEALAQAEIWMKIAAQSKTDGTLASRGAIDAADWAIARSLTALKVKEQSSPVNGEGRICILSSGRSVGSSTVDQSL